MSEHVPEPRLRHSPEEDEVLKRDWTDRGRPLECTVPADEHQGPVRFTLRRPRCELHYPMFYWSDEITRPEPGRGRRKN